MACDYLAIQGSSVAPEQVLPVSLTVTGTLHRKQLSPETFEALQPLKDSDKSGIMT
ncbi:hypothetical protein ARMSODRAFT_946474 [Armillaria solidipes]|uniref:Uncharacterized protein n=1 Tax=Armillaria solidipes TaxID=1076256 RepID=A0A2H3CNE6_9AGAR|nr:hypothetical protein ARMSODRAFT_946474 [Armillaria solidipes]